MFLKTILEKMFGMCFELAIILSFRFVKAMSYSFLTDKIVIYDKIIPFAYENVHIDDQWKLQYWRNGK